MDLTITGLEQVQRAIKDAAPQIVSRSFAKALDRAAGVIAGAVAGATPEGEEGLLEESVEVQVEVDAGKRGGAARVGFSKRRSERTDKPQDLIALLVETGHVMLSHSGQATKLDHVPAHPFMRPAFEVSADHAIEVFAEVLTDELAKP